MSGSTYRSSNGCDRALQVGSVTSGANGRTLGSPYDCPPFAVVAAAADDVAIGTKPPGGQSRESARTRSHWPGGQARLSLAGRGVLDGVHQSPNRRGRPSSYTAQASGSAAGWIELMDGLTLDLAHWLGVQTFPPSPISRFSASHHHNSIVPGRPPFALESHKGTISPTASWWIDSLAVISSSSRARPRSRWRATDRDLSAEK